MKDWTLEEQKQHRKDWVNALRSGDYKQGTGVLRDKNDNYCCLGVACDLAGVEWRAYDGCYKALINGVGSDTSLPSPVMSYFGMRDRQGRFYGEWNNILVMKNDCEKCTFDEIADIIESEPQGLFI